MDRDQFRSLLHDALSNIHDYAILEKHPLNDLIPRPDLSVLRAENLKRFIWNGIESLKPDTQQPQIDSLEWRYYLILSGRYIEGASVADMQHRLALGERQERRLHGKACRTLEEVLYDRLFPLDEINKSLQRDRFIQPVEGTKPEIAEESTEKDFSFLVSLEPLHLDMVINETAALILPQLQAHGGDLSIQVPSNLAMVQADRIILRQILLYLFNCILQNWACNDVTILVYPNINKVFLEISSWVKASFVNSEGELRSNKLLTYWLEKLGAQLQVELLTDAETNFSDPESSFQIRYALELPVVNQEKILVVDDHEPAIRIIKRLFKPNKYPGGWRQRPNRNHLNCSHAASKSSAAGCDDARNGWLGNSPKAEVRPRYPSNTCNYIFCLGTAEFSFLIGCEWFSQKANQPGGIDE